MTKPVILAVDDDHEVLAAVVSDLRRRYRDDYRVMSASSAGEALTAIQELQRRGVPIALFLIDQRMPDMSGTEFLVEARKLFPDTKRVLLTAYADSEAAIAAINQVGLDHYLRKPWEPPDQYLYPILDDLLGVWRVHARFPYEGLRVAGSRWAPQSYRTREFLSSNQVPYQWIDIDDDAPTRELVIRGAGDLSKLPVVFLADGKMLVAPTNAELAEHVGMETLAKRDFYDLVIVGAGPAGLASAVYASSEGLKVLLVEQSAPGGQAGTSSLIENYLGFPSGLSGADLAFRASTQAKRFGTELLVGTVTGVRRADPYRFVQLSNGKEVSCHALIIATGMAVRELTVPGLSPLVGAGVYYGAAAGEVSMHRGRDMCIVGGANSAGQGALFCSRSARHVTMLVRAAELGEAMSQYLVDRIRAADNITVLNRVELTAACAEGGRLQSVDARHLDSGEAKRIEASALFIFIGVAPYTKTFVGVVELDDKGFIITGPDLKRSARGWSLDRDPLMFETSVPGVFAVGDVRSGANRRIAAAVGEGSAAVFSVHQYLRTV